MKTVYMLCALGSLVGFSVGAGCWVVAENHCGNLEGDRTCADRGGGAYCNTCQQENDGCSDERPVDGCQHLGSEQGTATGVVEETTTGGTPPVDTGNVTLPLDTTNSTSEGVSAEGTTVGETGCGSDEDCEGGTPYCGPDGECVASCGGTVDPDAACAGKYSEQPICVNDACVSCADGLMLDGPMTGECLPCTEHYQCESGACDIFEGTCFDPERVVEVGGGGQPNSIEGGLMELQMGVDLRGERRGVLVLGGNFNEAVIIDNEKYDAVALIAAQGSDVNWRYEGGVASSTLTVNDAATRVYLDRVLLRNNTTKSDGQSLRCNDSHVDIRRSRLIENLGGGIVAQGQCELVVQSSFIGVNPNETVTTLDGGVDALLITNINVKATILYSTLGAGLNAAALRCPNGGPNVNVRNSFLVSLSYSTEEVDCLDAILTTTATEAEADPWSILNPADLSDMDPSWFENYDGGDFRLTSNAPDGIMVAQWLADDPMVDIEGEQRVLDQLDYAGADRP